MSHLGPNELRFVEALRAHDEPSEDDRARVRAGVLAKIAAAAAGATALSSAADAAASSPVASGAGLAAQSGATLGAAAGAGATTIFGSALALKLGLATLGVAGAGLALMWGVSSTPASRSVAPSADPAAPIVVTSRPAPDAKRLAVPADSELVPVSPSALPLEDGPEPRAGAAAPPRATPGVSNAGASSLDAELALISAAQQAMQKGAPAPALALLDRHATEFPRGVLALERSGLRVIALCQAGRLAEGRTLAESFLAGNPKSPLSARIRASCKL